MAKQKHTLDELENLKINLNQKMFNYKSEIIDKVDDVLTELRISRSEQVALSHRVSVHSDQIERIEKHLKLPTIN